MDSWNKTLYTAYLKFDDQLANITEEFLFNMMIILFDWEFESINKKENDSIDWGHTSLKLCHNMRYNQINTVKITRNYACIYRNDGVTSSWTIGQLTDRFREFDIETWVRMFVSTTQKQS